MLENLNPAQREAVEATEGPCLVLAGAGSGKTRVLTHRLAHLIHAVGVEPSSVVAVTFTNKAAQEMRERAESLLGAHASLGCFIGTFHAYCVRMLRRYAERAGYRREFLIYDTPEQLQVVRRVLRELDLSEKDFTPKSVLWRISTEKNKLVTPEEFGQRLTTSPLLRAVAQVWPRYQEILREASAFDFDDLIQVVVRLLQQDVEVRKVVQERTRYLLVDEYQGTNPAQYQLIKLLVGRHKNLFVVGDEDQSIFAWRGADISNILDFERDFPNSRIFRLEQNYRSTGNILRAAIGLVSRNEARKGKNLWTENQEGDSIRHYLSASAGEEVLLFHGL